MTIGLPDDLWLHIWQMVDPVPPEMGALRGINRQHRRVLDDDAMWQFYSPKAMASGGSLRAAFIERTERRTLQGNAMLAEAYSARSQIDVHCLQPGFLLLGPFGRDEDYDAAHATHAYPEAWQFFSQILRNDEAIGGRACQRNPRVLPWLGRSLYTSGRISAALEADGSLMRYMSKRVREDPSLVRKAICSSGLAFQHIAAHLKQDRDLALLQIKTHPEHAYDVLPLYCNDRAFFTQAVIRNLPSWRPFDFLAGEELLQDRSFLLEAINAYTCSWVYRRLELDDDADFMQKMWKKSDENARPFLFRNLSDRLRLRWGVIEDPEFLL